MLTIRPEQPDDYAAIADLHATAFDNRPDEAMIVALHRQRAAYDPDLALVAIDSGQVVGHALFSPYQVQILGEPVRAVLLAPIGVYPAKQRQGIGAQLMEAGHWIARDKGYQLAFLLGHPNYYPRFGYQTGVYGGSSVRVETPYQAERLTVRPVTKYDVPSLATLWQYEEGGVDFALVPTATFYEWLRFQTPALVYERQGQVVGYRCGESVFMAADAAAAQAMVYDMADGATHVTLPLHPYSASAQAFEQQPTATAWEAGMALPLGHSPFDEYALLVQRGERVAGRPIFPAGYFLEG